MDRGCDFKGREKIFILFLCFAAARPRDHGVWAHSRGLNISPPAHPNLLGITTTWFFGSAALQLAAVRCSLFIALEAADQRPVAPVRHLSGGRSQLGRGRLTPFPSWAGGAAPGLFATVASVYRCVSPLVVFTPSFPPFPSKPLPVGPPLYIRIRKRFPNRF